MRAELTRQTASERALPGGSGAELVSIIIPTRNRRILLGETLKTAFAQNYQPIEVIVVDDGSSDGTYKMVQHLKRNCPAGKSVSILKSKGIGAPAARNQGLCASRGDYIQFFDSDDLMLPTFVSDRLAVLRADWRLDFCACNFDVFREQDKVCGEYRFENLEHTLEGHLLRFVLNTSNFLARRTAIQYVGLWREDLKSGQDVEFTARMFLRGLRGRWLPKRLFRVRSHTKQISSGETNEVRQSSLLALLSIEKEAERLGKMSPAVREAIGRRMTGLARRYLKAGHGKLARQCFWQGWQRIGFSRKGLQGLHFLGASWIALSITLLRRRR